MEFYSVDMFLAEFGRKIIEKFQNLDKFSQSQKIA